VDVHNGGIKKRGRPRKAVLVDPGGKSPDFLDPDMGSEPVWISGNCLDHTIQGTVPEKNVCGDELHKTSLAHPESPKEQQERLGRSRGSVR
jgi:hypothetical protein